MIEPTDEMVDAYRDAFHRAATVAAKADHYVSGDITRAGLAAVLAIVERDHLVYPRTPGSPYEPTPDRERCTFCDDPTDWHSANGCEGDFGHCPCQERFS